MNAAFMEQPAPAAMLSERVVDEWLVLEAPLAGPGQGSAAELLLEVNAALRGGIKVVLTAEQQARLRAELPWDSERASGEAKAAAIAGLEELRRRWPDTVDARVLTVQPLPSASGEALNKAAAECGWPVSTRRDGSLAADLEVPGRHEQAHFAALQSGGLLAIAEVAQVETAGPESRRAIATLLLLAGGTVRGARPALRTIDEKPVAIFEACLPAAPSPLDLTNALSSLSLAIRLCGEEARTFLHEQIAKDYLEVGASVSQPTSDQ